MNELARRWLAFAGEDLRMAELAFNESLWNQVCFHSHQCAEKSLKALVAVRGGSTPRTHRLTDLLTLIEEPDLEELAGDLRSLESFYMPTRYPDAVPGSLPEALPGEREAGEALATARKVLDVVRGRGCGRPSGE
jgi:HEPN domain-containing protein